MLSPTSLMRGRERERSAAAETSVGAAPVDSTETLRIASLTMLFAVQVIVPLNFQLDLGHRLDFVRKPRGIDELGIDLGEIHEGKVEPGEFLDRKAKALLLLGSAPGLAELNSSLLLQDAAELAFKAAIGRSPGLADSEKARRTVSADLVAEARSEEHTSELQSLMRISYAVFCLKKKIRNILQDNQY